MRTARFPSSVLGGGGMPPDADPAGRPPPPKVNRMTDGCENIALPQTLFACSKNCTHHTKWQERSKYH